MDPKIRSFCRLRQAGLVTITVIFLAACSPAANPAVTPTTVARVTRAGQLTPYISRPTGAVVTGSPDPAVLSTATPLPSPTATPRIHEVKKGEDMGGIAWKYRVSLEALMAANPTVQPNMMSVGTRLVIPPSQTQVPGEDDPASAGSNPPTPTLVPVTAGNLRCAPVEDGGMWCFLPVRNTLDYPLEGFSAVFHLAGQQSSTVQSQMAFLPLDRLEPGARLPLVAYFPPEQIAQLAPPYQTGSELLTALPSPDDGRYLPAHLKNIKVMLAENGRSADLTADIILEGSRSARRVWVAAVAYDAQGNVAGVRRWEKQSAQPLERGQALAITMSVYSVFTEIERVELSIEARP